MECIETVDYKGYKINIYPDEINESPREWDNLGIMVCFHGRYTLGDKTELTSDMFDNWAELREYLVKKEGAILISPLYMYDHSGIRIKIGSFSGLLPQGHAEFDSGRIGFIYTTKKKILECYGSYGEGGKLLSKRVSKKMLEKAEQILTGEVKTYDQYCAGAIYGYIIEAPNDEEFGGCWGFYGYDNEKSGLLSEARNEINCEIKYKKKKYTKKLIAQIKGNTPLSVRKVYNV